MATVEVLLREDVENLGRRGQVVRVRAGYARNYLLPRGLAVLATSGNLRAIQQEKQLLERREARERTQAEKVSERLRDMVLTFSRKAGDQDVLFGSVTALDIAHALAEQGIEVDRRKILLEHPIKHLGEYTIAIKLHRDVTAQLKIQVVPEESD